MSAQSEVLSPDERCERVNMALADSGLPPAAFIDHGIVRYEYGAVPKSAAWRAAMIAAPHQIGTCWPCFDADPWHAATVCGHDPMTSPWPEVVR